MTSPVLANFGASQLLIIAALALFLFGGKKIPELMKGLGTGLKEFKKATQSEDVEDKKIEKKDSDNPDENKKDLTVSK